MKGPKPVCTSARKKTNQSSPRRLAADGPARRPGGAGTGGAGTLGACLRAAAPLLMTRLRDNVDAVEAAPPPLRSVPRRRSSARRLRRLRGAEHDHRLARLVFGRKANLVARELERDAVRPAVRREVQRVPIDRDLAAADAEEAAEIDDGRPHLPGLID